MDYKGFSLIETLLGLFLLGVIVITCLPILNSGLYNINRAREKVLMLWEIESIIEKIKAYDYIESDQYILDMKLEDLMEILNRFDTITIDLPIENNSTFKYSCNIHKKNRGEYLWELHLILNHNEDTRIKEIDIMTIISTPQKVEWEIEG